MQNIFSFTLIFSTAGKIMQVHKYFMYLQIAQANLQVEIFKRVQFFSMFNGSIKLSLSLLLLLFSLQIQAVDQYVTISDLNLRTGAGKSYKSIGVIEKGDTVKLIKKVNSNWTKIKYNKKIGYCAAQFLTKVNAKKSKKSINRKTTKNESHPFLMFLIWIGIFVGCIVALVKSGNKYRSKLFATFISFFFGAFGFQKYYLGQKNKGTYSVLFCWTFIPSLIGLIDFVKLVIMKKDDFNNKYNRGLQKQSQKTKKFNTQKNTSADHSIIDVISEKLDLSIEISTPSEDISLEPPYWRKTYVYSYDELRDTTQTQKKFYFFFKNRFLSGEFVDIQGNTNYAFILYFDLLNEYESHKDIKLLEEQFKLLGQICSNTKSYTLSSLKDLLRERTDSFSIDKLNDLQDSSYQYEQGYSDYDPDEYKLGKLYKDKLGLNKIEVAWLNKFWNPSNVFISIEGCCIATIKQYIFILKELNKKLKSQETTVTKEVVYFKDKLKKLYLDSYNSEWGYYDASWINERAESDVYLTIFKRIENSVRESYGHKRKISGDFPNSDIKLVEEFESRLGNYLNNLIIEFEHNIGKPDTKTIIELNSQNVNRWKIEFAELKDSFQKEAKAIFIEGIINLEEVNQKNPNIENIFFESSKFIAKYDKVQSLKDYAKYIYYDLKSKKFDNKELTKTVQKSLFKTEEQINDFKKIISELMSTSDIQKSLDEIANIYIFQRERRLNLINLKSKKLN